MKEGSWQAHLRRAQEASRKAGEALREARNRIEQRERELGELLAKRRKEKERLARELEGLLRTVEASNPEFVTSLRGRAGQASVVVHYR
jgi:hypothetical protein